MWGLPCLTMWHSLRAQAKTMQGGEVVGGGAGAGGLSTNNFGPKYEAHVSELQSQLEEAKTKCAPCALYTNV